MADFLTTFYEESRKKGKGDVSPYLQTKVGTSKNNKYDFYDTFASDSNPELAKKISSVYGEREKQRQSVIDSGLNAGLPWEDISQKTGIPLSEVQSFSEKTRPDYGINKVPSIGERAKQAAEVTKNVGQGIYEGIVQPAGRAISQVSEVVTGSAQKQAKLVDNLIAQVNSNDKLSSETKSKIEQDLLKKKQSILEGALGNAGFDINTAPSTILRKSISDIGQTASLAVPADLGIKALAGKEAAQLIKAGALSGAVGGALSGLGADQVTAKGIAQGTAVGASLGAAIPAIAGKVSSLRTKNDIGDIKTQPNEVVQIVKKGTDGKSETTFYRIPTSQRDEIVKAVDGTDKAGIAGESLDGEITHISARSPEFMAQNGVKDGGVYGVTKPPFERLSSIDEKLTKTKNPEKAAALAVERQSLVQSLPPAEQKLAQDASVVSKQALSADQEISSVARKTNERSIAKGLTLGFDDLPVYERANFAEQRKVADKIVKQDGDSALQIALGKQAAPEGVEPALLYRAVEDKALKDGDNLTLQLLASKSSLPTEATKRGQFNAAFGYKDPDSPVDAIREINNLRDAAQKRGIKIPNNVVTTEETKDIVDLAKVAEGKKNAWIDSGGKIDDPARLEFGRAQVAFRNKINDLKLEANQQTLKEKGPLKVAGEITGNIKALQSSMDNSALFRQGWKTLWSHPGQWQKNARKTFTDLVKTFGGKDTLDEVAADITSRPNSKLYKKAKLAVGIDEEAFPESFGEKLPLLGRAYKASEAAYTGFLQRQRADIFDKYIDIAQKTGVDLNNKELKSIGKMVNTLTSRGDLGKLEPAGDALNRLFFSPRMLASHIQVLTHPLTGAGGSNFVRKQAAKNLLKIVGGTAAVLGVAEAARPGSVDWDPRSSNFGKIKVGNTRFDVTGGVGSVLTLASRLATMSKKSSTTGDVQSLSGGGFGKQDGGDVVVDFFENKFSPVAGILRDIVRGEDFNGNKPTARSIAAGAVTPLVIQNATQAKQPNSANALAALIADGLGISAGSYSSSPNWKVENSKELAAFKNKVGGEKFNQAYNKFNQQYSNWETQIQNNSRFKKLSNDDKQTVRTKKAQDIRSKILEDYNFSYKSEKKPRGRLEGF